MMDIRILTACAVLLSGTATAGNIQLSPIGMTLAPQQRIERMRVINNGAEASTLQFQAFTWTQVDGKNVETATTGVRFSPAIAVVEPGAEQVVRVIRIAPPMAMEDPYRIRATELPNPARKAQGVSASLLLTYNLPLFYRPDGAQPNVRMRWEKSTLLVSNTGSATAQIAALGPVGKAPWRAGLVGYVLPGSTMRFPMPATASSVQALVNGSMRTLTTE